MITKCIAFLVAALVLANCCALGGGCAPLGGGPAGPVALGPGGGPVALDDDGLGEAPPDEAQSSDPQPKQDARPKRKNMAGSLDAGATRQNRGAQAKDQFELQQAADEADDLRLKRKLMICSDCMPSKPARDDAMSSSR
jgi:hypothetical protein